MARNNKIYPMAFKPKNNTPFKLYYVGFPKEWKERLVKIQRTYNPKWKDEYGIATYSLKKSLEVWLDGVIAMKSLRINSNDEKWLVSCNQEIDISKLFMHIKIWVLSYFGADDTRKDVILLVKDFVDNMNIEALAALSGCCDEVLFSSEKKSESEEDYSFTALPLMAVNRLIGKTLIIDGREVKFNYAGKTHLISDIQRDGAEIFSYGIEFSLQTIPPYRHPIFLCNTVIHRWIPSNWGNPSFKDKINAHIWVGNDRIYKLPICSKYYPNEKRSRYYWDNGEKEYYNLYNYGQLPNEDDFLENVEEYISKNKIKITLPYKNGMDKGGFTKNLLGTGVSVKEKHNIYEGVYERLYDIVEKCDEVEKFENKNILVDDLSLSPNKLTPTQKDIFVNRLAECIKESEFNLEIYYANNLEECADVLLNQAKDIFISNENIKINIIKKALNFMGEELDDDKSGSIVKRINEIKSNIEFSDKVTGCIIVLPDKEHFKIGDPKAAIRCGFAHTNRLTQFITPWIKNDDTVNLKISSAFEDLVRQLGFLKPLKKDTKLIEVPTIGIHMMSQLNSIKGKARFLPLFVIVDYKNASVTVECNAFDRINIPYKEAEIELAKLSLKDDFSDKCNNASRNMFKQKMKLWKNVYRNKDVLILIESNGNTRALCPGISDSNISRYEYDNLYCPKEIEIGTKESSCMESFEKSKLRLVRIRCNGEVPDYFTDMSSENKYISTSGIFKYGLDFWAIAVKPNDKSYNKSYSKTKNSLPKQKLAECDMIEIYPIMLQNGDEPIDWIRYTNAMRSGAIQYDNLTVKPIAIHLAEKLEEYILEAK